MAKIAFDYESIKNRVLQNLSAQSEWASFLDYGVIDNITETKHAIGIVADDDANILIHVGLDTVKLGGRGFDVKVEEGAKIKKGDLLMTFDLSAIKKSGYKVTTPIVVCNSDEFHSVEIIAQGDVNAGDAVMKIVKWFIT